MTACLRMLILSALTLAAGSAGAQSSPRRLDDSASLRGLIEAPVVLSEQGKPLADTLDARSAHVHFGQVAYRLSTAAYVGRQVRIFYVIPQGIPWLRSPSGMTVEWRPGAQLAGGTAHPGERRPVWSGIIQTPWFSDAIDLSWQVDLSQVDFRSGARFGIEAYFEIEVIR